MAPARPYWKGYLRLALVTCPVALYSGTSSTERVSFRQINKQTGNRLRQQLVDEVTREPVERDDKGRGYEYAKGAYILVEDDELEAIAVESNHTIEIDAFVPRDQIEEMGVPSYGLEEVGRLRRTLGEYQAELVVDGGTAVLHWSKEGKPLKSVPAAVKKEHG